MSTLQSIRRVTIYAAQALEANLIEQILKLGSKGYTITEARGLGEHAALDDPFARSAQIRIELLVQPQVAAKIMEYVLGMSNHHLAVVACVEDVEVCSPEHF